MEISPLSNVSLKIKGKKGTLIVDPEKSQRSKIEADGILVLNRESQDTAKVENERVILQGPGEYEVGGIKISAIKAGKQLVYILYIDGIGIALANLSSLESVKDFVSGQQVFILSVDASIDPSLLATLEPKVCLFYGEKAKDIAKEGITTAGKFSITREKLPEKMEAIILN